MHAVYLPSYYVYLHVCPAYPSMFRRGSQDESHAARIERLLAERSAQLTEALARVCCVVC